MYFFFWRYNECWVHPRNGNAYNVERPLFIYFLVYIVFNFFLNNYQLLVLHGTILNSRYGSWLHLLPLSSLLNVFCSLSSKKVNYTCNDGVWVFSIASTECVWVFSIAEEEVIIFAKCSTVNDGIW